MDIKEWANINGMTPDEFKNEIVITMAAIASMELDKSASDKDMIVWTVEYNGKPLQITSRYVSE